MVRRIGGLVVLAAMVALGGCAVDQKKEVATYRKVLGGETRSIAASFVSGQPLTLAQALALANEQNENLGLRGEDYLQSLINRDRAAAAFLPTVSLAALYTRTNDIPAGGNHSFTLPVGAQMNLFNGFRDVAAMRAAAANINQRRAILLDLQSSVLLNVAQTYYLVLRAERSVEVLRNSLRVQEERVKYVQAQLTVGRARPLDVAQSQAQAAGSRVLLVQAQSDARNGRTQLAFLTGASVQDSPFVDAFDLPAALPPLPQVQTTAHALRQDLQAARSAAAAARQEVEVAVGAYWPTVSLAADYFLNQQSPRTQLEWDGILNASIPIFSAGLIEANVRAAWSGYRQAKLTESLTSRQVSQDVELAYQNIQASDERMASLRTQVASAREALRLAEGLNRAGQGIYLDVLTAQDSLQSAQLNLSNEEFNRKIFYLNLVRVSGQLSTRVPGEPTTRPATAPTTLP